MKLISNLKDTGAIHPDFEDSNNANPVFIDTLVDSNLVSKDVEIVSYNDELIVDATYSLMISNVFPIQSGSSKKGRRKKTVCEFVYIKCLVKIL